MARSYVIEAGGQRFEGKTASAKAQMEALHICMRTGLVSVLQGEKASEMGLVAAMGSLNYEDVQRLISLVIEGCVKRSDDVPVAENLFSDQIQDYYLLIMRALVENVGPFWNLRRQTGAEATEAESGS